MPRGLPKGDVFFLENCPRMGAFAPTGESGNVSEDLPCWTTMDIEPLLSGWLYIHVAHSTVEAPMTKLGVILKLNRMTEARKERTMDRLVAKPFRMLSEYLMTMAVTSPPNTCTDTVAHAHPPKFRNTSRKKPRELGGDDEKRIGRRAGMMENNDNCTLRTQRSAFEPFNTISKYTPANPEVKHAAVTAPNPFRGLIMWICRGAASWALPTGVSLV